MTGISLRAALREGGRDDLTVSAAVLELGLGLAPLQEPRAPGDADSQPRDSLPPAAAVPPLVARVLSGTVGVPPGRNRCYLFSGRGELIEEAVERSASVRRRAVTDLAAFERAPVQEADGERVLLAALQRIAGYWHWWIDVLPRIWLLDEHAPGSDRCLPLVFPRLEQGFQLESLRALGLLDRVRTLEPGLTRFGSVTFTEGLTGGGSRYPSTALAGYSGWLRERLGIAPWERGQGRRLYVSRADAATRRVVNEDELEPVLRTHGFERVECSALPLAEQIRIFSEASAVIGPHGAGLTNLLFASSPASVIEVFCSGAELDISNYRVLASHLGFEYRRLPADPFGDPRRRSHDRDMRLDPGRLDEALDELPL